ncbi:MAG: hypothetical protein OXE59_03965 [Bacteroidetes bacterium]|nr:hypothetical protein [Bacteroidota bacterium]
MCVILDVNVVHEVINVDSPDAEKEFFKWINKGRGLLIIGGKLTDELSNA